jgi:hypothetical protein
MTPDWEGTFPYDLLEEFGWNSMHKLHEVLADEEPALDKGRTATDPAIWKRVVGVIIWVGYWHHFAASPLPLKRFAPSCRPAVTSSISKALVNETFVRWHQSFSNYPDEVVHPGFVIMCEVVLFDSSPAIIE